jgi:type II secretory pathway pseudopilin PulG
MQHHRRSAGFSITDLLIVIVVIAAMLVMQIPTDAAARRTARRMQNSTQLRGIHQGLVIFGQSNKFFYVGVDSKGVILANDGNTTGNSGDGDTVQARYWIMMRGDFFTPEYAISPSETNNVTQYPVRWDNDLNPVDTPVQWSREGVKHYSYAMLGIAGDAGAVPAAQGRAMEWKETANTQAIVLSDRNTGRDANQGVQSIHTSDRGEWAGSVLWNDNHVGFEQTHNQFETKYGNGRLNVGEDFGDPADNLFADDAINDNQPGYDALMVIAGDSIVHGNE